MSIRAFIPRLRAIRRTAALALAMVMLIGLFPTTAFSITDADPQVTLKAWLTVASETVYSSKSDPSQTITETVYDGLPVESQADYECVYQNKSDPNDIITLQQYEALVVGEQASYALKYRKIGSDPADLIESSAYEVMQEVGKNQYSVDTYYTYTPHVQVDDAPVDISNLTATWQVGSVSTPSSDGNTLTTTSTEDVTAAISYDGLVVNASCAHDAAGGEGAKADWSVAVDTPAHVSGAKQWTITPTVPTGSIDGAKFVTADGTEGYTVDETTGTITYTGEDTSFTPTVYVVGKDNGSRIYGKLNYAALTVDQAEPTYEITTSPAAGTNNGGKTYFNSDLTITVTATDAAGNFDATASSVEYTLNDIAQTPATFTGTVAEIPLTSDGEVKLTRIVVADTFGNETTDEADEDTLTATYVLDKTAPTVTLSADGVRVVENSGTNYLVLNDLSGAKDYAVKIEDNSPLTVIDPITGSEQPYSWSGTPTDTGSDDIPDTLTFPLNSVTDAAENHPADVIVNGKTFAGGTIPVLANSAVPVVTVGDNSTLATPIHGTGAMDFTVPITITGDGNPTISTVEYWFVDGDALLTGEADAEHVGTATAPVGPADPYTINVTPSENAEGVAKLYLRVTDSEGYIHEPDPVDVKVDTKAPRISYSYAPAGTPTANTYYDAQKAITVTVEDDNLNTTTSKVNYTIAGEDAQSVSFTVDATGTATATVTVTDGQKLTSFNVNATDTCGNNVQEAFDDGKLPFTVDKTPPEVSFDKLTQATEDESAVVNGHTTKKYTDKGNDDYYIYNDVRYYSSNKTVLVIGTDANFDDEEGSISATVGGSTTEKFTASSTDKWGSADTESYQKGVTFEDGDRVTGISATAWDKAGNDTTESNDIQFVVDTTNPEAAIAVDTAGGVTVDADPTTYYSSAKLVTITVTEANFNSAGAFTTVAYQLGDAPETTIDGLTWSQDDGKWVTRFAVSDAAIDSSVTISELTVPVKIQTTNKALKKITVKPADLAGNVGTLVNTDSSLSMIVDTTDPTAEMGFYKVDDQTAIGVTQLSSNDSIEMQYFDEGVRIRVTVTDANFDSKKSVIVVTTKVGEEEPTAHRYTNDESITDGQAIVWTQDTTDQSKWTATILVTDQSGDGTRLVTSKNAIITLNLTAYDRAGRSFATDPSYTNFLVDTTQPVLKTFTVPSAALGGGTEYYNEAQTIQVVISDAHFKQDATSVKVTMSDNSVHSLAATWVKDSITDDYTATISFDETLCKTTSGAYRAVKKVEVTSEDHAGNKLVKDDGLPATVVSETAGTWYIETNFVVDTTAPKVTAFTVPAGETNGALKYYNANQTVTVTVEEQNFNTADANNYLEIILSNNSTIKAQNPAWTQDGDAYTATVTIQDSNLNDTSSDSAYLTVKTAKLVAADRSGNKVTNANSLSGVLTADLNAWLYVETNFLVDTVAPELIAFTTPDSGLDHSTIAYYGETKQIIVTAKEKNFDTTVVNSYVSVTMSDNTTKEAYATWVKSTEEGRTDEYTATITVNDAYTKDTNGYGIAVKEVKVVAQDLAGRKLAKTDSTVNGTSFTSEDVSGYSASANFIVDTDAIETSEIEIALPDTSGIPSRTVGSNTVYYFDANQNIVVTVADANFNPEAASVTVTVGESTDNEFDSEELTWSKTNADGKWSTTIIVTDVNDSTVSTNNKVEVSNVPVTKVAVSAQDFVQANAASANKDDLRFIVDTTAPEISYDIPTGQQFRSSIQTVKVTVKDHNFDAANSAVKVDGENVAAEWVAIAPIDAVEAYQMTFTLGDYGALVKKTSQFGSVVVDAKDFSDNGGVNQDDPTSSSAALGFTVDTAAPSVSISFNSTPVNVSGGINYYDTPQTIQCSASDTNLSSQSITAVVNGETKHLSSMTLTVSDANGQILTNEGPLTSLTITATDQAGHSSSTTINPNMIVDTTAPVVSAQMSSNIAGVLSREENGSTAYYIVPKTLVSSETRDDEPIEEEYSVTLNVEDRNIALTGTVNQKDYNLTFRSEDGTETWVKNGDSYTVEKRVRIQKNATGVIRFQTRVIDLAGNTPKEDIDIVSTGLEEGMAATAMRLHFDDGGNGTIDARIDRRQSSTEFDAVIPDVKVTPNVQPVGTALGTTDTQLFDGSFNAFSMTIYDGRPAAGDSATQTNNSGIAEVTWSLDDGLQNVSFLTTDGNDRDDLTHLTDVVYEKAYRIPIIAHGQNETNEAKLTITIRDNVGNVITVPIAFAVDNLSPRVSVTYDNNDVRNNTYFRANRIASIEVTDINFDPLDSSLYEITTAVAHSAWTSDGSIHRATVAYAQDGDYTFAMHAADRARNMTADGSVIYNGAAPNRFTVDKTAPIISVSYDNNSSHNDKYYNAVRTASIVITEHNFDQRQGLRVAAVATEGTAPHASGFSTGSDRHVATVPFLEDGAYTLAVEYTDLAGNPAEPYRSGEFIIDTVPPEIVITGVQMINTDVAAPIITFTDENFDTNGYSVETLFSTGLRSGVLTQLSSTVSGADRHGAVVSYNDTPHTKSSDGIYELTARATDLAGNESESVKITYSVNRFGSTYFTDDDVTKSLAVSGYARSSTDLQIIEFNPNQLSESTVTLTVNGKTITLNRGSDYSMVASGNDSSGYRYLYSIFSTAFEESGEVREGAYIVTLSSVDSAGNTNSNRSNADLDSEGNESTLELNFTIDATPPLVMITGIQDGDRIQESNREVTVYFSDGNEVASVEIYLNDELTYTFAGQELASLGGEYLFNLVERDNDQTLRVLVRDLAGNEADSGNYRFYLNSSALMQFAHNRGLLYGSISGAVVLAGGIIYLFTSPGKAAIVSKIANGAFGKKRK